MVAAAALVGDELALFWRSHDSSSKPAKIAGQLVVIAVGARCVRADMRHESEHTCPRYGCEVASAGLVRPNPSLVMGSSI